MDRLQDIYAKFLNEDLDAAASDIQDVLYSEPHNPKALHLAGIIAKSQGDFSKAHEYITQALKIEPSDPEIYNTLGNNFDAAKELKRAGLAYEASLRLNATYEPALKNLAFLRLKQNNPIAAIEIFKHLIAVDPKNELYGLGYVHALKDSEQALAALEYLELLQNPDTADERTWIRGQLLFDLGRYEEAILANQGLLNSPGYGANAIATTAQILHMQGSWAIAEPFLTGMMVGDNINPETRAATAKAFLKAGHAETAVEIISAGLAELPNDPYLLSLRGQIHRATDQADLAYKDAMAALQAKPGDTSMMSEMALSALAAGYPESALIAANEALKQNPDDQFWIAIRATGGRATGQDYGYYFDYDKYVRFYDLPAPKGYNSIGEFNAELQNALDDLHKFKDAPLDQSVRGGIQTSPNLVYLKHSVLETFFEMIDMPIKEYIAEIGTAPRHPLTRRNTGEYRLHSAWSVRLSAGGYHVNHVHPEGWISSSYYVDIPENLETDKDKAGWISFGEPPTKTDGLGPELDLPVKTGRLVLFPSYLWHGTIPIKEGTSRLTLPFDVVPA